MFRISCYLMLFDVVVMYYTLWPGWLYLNKIWVRIQSVVSGSDKQHSRHHTTPQTSHYANPQLHQGGDVSAETLSEHFYDRQAAAAGSQHHHYWNHRVLLCLLPGLIPSQSIWWGADDVGLCCVSHRQHSHHGNTALPPPQGQTALCKWCRWW